MPPVYRRVLVATLLLVSGVTVAGCTTTEDFTTSIDEPSTGKVIDNLAVTDINDVDGVLYEIEYSLDPTDTAAYNVEAYELTGDSAEFLSISNLDQQEPTHQNDVPPPWDAGEERRYEIRIIHEDTDTVVDSVTFTVTRSAT